MNPTDTGKAIASLRKKAGYTQADLAEALGVSDKAVSKWERGIACPDISFLPKLSVLLDTDIEGLLSGDIIPRERHWRGILITDKLAGAIVHSKPLINYLLSNFLLVGIREVLIISDGIKDQLKDGRQYGMKIEYDKGNIGEVLNRHPSFISGDVMMIYGNVIVYGAHLTRKYQNLMAYEKGAYNLQTHKGAPVPMIFITKEAWDKARHVGEWKTVADMLGAMKPEYRSFVRGITSLPATNKTEIRKAAGFVKTIEETEGEAIAELQELAQSRGLIKE